MTSHEGLHEVEDYLNGDLCGEQISYVSATRKFITVFK
jgi:hypothetical protein